VDNNLATSVHLKKLIEATGKSWPCGAIVQYPVIFSFDGSVPVHKKVKRKENNRFF